MGFSSFLKRFIVNATILILFITFMPGLLPDVSITKSFKVFKATLDGKLTPNKKLDKVEILFKGDLLGPESFTDDKNYLYTSLHTGDIVKIAGKHIVPVVTFGKPCKGFYEERICGRPLGIKFGSDGYLYAADAYYGIFKVDVDTGEKTKLVSFGEEIDGKPTKVPNSVAVSCNGDVYWTDSSSNFLLQDGLFAFLDDPSGRLIHYNAKTGKNKVLVDGILFANGVALSKNEDFVIVSDATNQILRRYIKGPKAGTTETFVRLPGIPDNIQTDGGSGFLVTVIIESNAESPSFPSLLSRFPNVRRFLARSLGLAELGFRFIDRLYPNEVCQKTLHYIGHISSVANIVPSRSIVLHVSENGEILSTLWTNNATIGKFSEAHIVKNYLYLGSPFNDYLGRIPLSEVGWEHLSKTSDSLTSKKQLCSDLYGKVNPKVPQQPKIDTVKPTAASSRTTTKPETTHKQKDTPAQKPTTTTQKATTTTQKPTATTQKPTTTTQKPTTTTQKPTTTTQKPTTATQKPTSTAQKPTAKAQEPSTKTQKPTTNSQKPNTVQKPTTTTQKPTPTAQQPKATAEKPTTTTQKPTTETQKPTTGTQKPSTISTPKPTVSPKPASTTQKPVTITKEDKQRVPTNPQNSNSRGQPAAKTARNEL
ncbi:adipocyte plasma membrane-associated protein-like [Coccinella septempunctata]|uniref:adipocyte plasma membrane-associated protein-like n=1 Tax=Coccinella septempunctata TaxID=41139 RepID=UPI001D06C6E0|nr:adipocyte plasma membrane-associated protein-like [Coccinella septempunctata]